MTTQTSDHQIIRSSSSRLNTEQIDAVIKKASKALRHYFTLEDYHIPTLQLLFDRAFELNYSKMTSNFDTEFKTKSIKHICQDELRDYDMLDLDDFI